MNVNLPYQEGATVELIRIEILTKYNKKIPEIKKYEIPYNDSLLNTFYIKLLCHDVL